MAKDQKARIVSLQAQIQALEDEKVEQEKQVEAMKQKANQICRDEDAAVAELEKKLKQIRAPFEALMKETNQKQDAAEKRIWQIPFAIEKVKAAIQVVEDEDKPTFDSAEGFRAFLNSVGVRISARHGFKMVEKQLPNGIRLFSHFDAWGNNSTAADAGGIAWFAVFEKKIVGFHLTEKGSHKADEATAWAWIGVRKLRKKNSLQGERKGLWGTFTTGIKQKDWKFRLSIAKVSELAAVDLDDATNKVVLAADERPSFINENAALSKVFGEDA